MTTVAGSNRWRNFVERADDGDPAAGATWQSVDELADRTAFLQQNAQLAIANHRVAKSVATIDRFRRACWAVGAGPFNVGMFAAVGKRSGGGAGLAFSPDGEQFYEYALQYVSILDLIFEMYGVAHGGAGAVGSRSFVFCGVFTDLGTDKAAIFSAPDDAEDNANPLIPEIAKNDIVLRYQSAGAGRLRSVCWNGTNFVAVGDDGLIVTLSANLLTATVRTAGSAYAGDFHYIFEDSAHRLFACGENGEIQRSTDNGVTWARVHSNALLGTLASGVAITLGAVESRVVGTSDGNKVLRSINLGASSSWAEVEIIPTATFDGSQVLVYKLGAMLGAVLRNETNDSVSMGLYSFDGGATWPVTNRTIAMYGSHADGAADNGQRAVIVGGTPDATTAAHIFCSGQIVAPV